MQIICHGLKEEDFPVEFTDHKIFLGRDESNSIVVDADGISRFHAILAEEGDDLFLQDNDSLNGTILNNNLIRSKQKLVHGDIIQIGHRLIRVCFFPDRKVVLDFIPPEQTEVVSGDSVDATLVSGTLVDSASASGAVSAVDATLVSESILRASSTGDEIEHTMVMPPETMPPTPNPSSSARQFSSGSEIGKYVIIKRIGKGGMGEVYLARHKTLGIFRALKILSNESNANNAKFFERFIREAKLASEIRHPNVVGVMDVETDSSCGVPYIVMEYIDGGSLRNSLTANKRLSEEQAVVIVEAIASALQAAEEHGIVHRDIKPDNIMFTKRGEVKLADLGIAKNSDKDKDLTKTNMMIGTPAYLPPEQAQNAKNVDGRADIYSLGATFYEMLTGEQPYPGNSSIEVLHKLFSDPVPDPRKVNPEISVASAAIVMKMLAKNPRDRFRNADELLDKMDRTFPPHTPHESCEVIKKVIAGECENNTEFSSSISSAHFFLWWTRIQNKRLVLSAAGLFIAICIVAVMFLFLKNPGFLTARHVSGTVNAGTENRYVLQIKTTPDSEIHFTFPDGRTKTYSSGHEGLITITELVAGNYETRISREHYRELSRSFQLKDDMMIDLPLETVAEPVAGTEEKNDPKPARGVAETTPVQKKNYVLRIRTTPDSKINIISSDGWTKEYFSDHDGSLSLSDLDAGSYEARISHEHYQTLLRKFDLKDNLTLTLPLNPGPLIVTTDTDKDVTNGADGRTSLRKAFNYAHANGGSISFDKNYEIRVSNQIPFSVSKNVTIDGENHTIVIRNLQNTHLFRVKNANLSLKNLSVISDYGIVDSSRGVVEFDSANDADRRKRNRDSYDGTRVVLTGTSRLHSFSGLNGASFEIRNGSVLEDLTLEMGSSCSVSGKLKFVSVNRGNISVLKNGIAENVTVRIGFAEHFDGGTIDGLNIGTNAVYGYEPNAFLTGKVSIGGVALEPTETNRLSTRSIVGGRTDIIFDLSSRTPGTVLNPKDMLLEVISKHEYSIRRCDYLVQNMKAFSGARSYTIRVNPEQTSGTYKLACNAAWFNMPVTLQIGDVSRQDVLLSTGKEYVEKNTTYSLSSTKDGMLTLKISRNNTKSAGNGSTASSSASSSSASSSGDTGKTTASAGAKGNDSFAGEKLQGALYILAPLAGREALLSRSPLGNKNGNSSLSSSGKKGTNNEAVYQILQKFALGSWAQFVSSKGQPYYSELDQHFKRQTVPGFANFYQNTVSWEKGATLFQCRNIADNYGWCAVYSGYLLAPFTGKFRFLGSADDMMVVRFNRQIVLDYGNRSVTTRLPVEPNSDIVLHTITTGEEVSYGSRDLRSLLAGNPTTKEERRMLNESPLYSKNKLEISFPEANEGNGLARSPILSVQKGQVIPFDIMIGEMCKDNFNMFLYIELLDANGLPIADPTRSSIYIFRTSANVPTGNVLQLGKDETSIRDNLPPLVIRETNPAPVWKIVDAKGKPISKQTQK